MWFRKIGTLILTLPLCAALYATDYLELSEGQMVVNFEKGPELLALDRNYVYAKSRSGSELKGALVTYRACGHPYADLHASRTSAHLEVLGALIDSCTGKSNDSYSSGFSPTTGNRIGVVDESQLGEVQEETNYFAPGGGLFGKGLYQVCLVGQGICI